MKFANSIRRVWYAAWNRIGGLTSVCAVFSGLLFFIAPRVSHHSPGVVDDLEYASVVAVTLATFLIAFLLPYVIHNVIRDEGFGSVWLAVLSTVVTLLVVAAWSDWMFDQVFPASFSTHLTRVDALYLAATTLTTAGSNIQPVSGEAEAVIMAQTAANLLVLGGLAAVILSRIEAARLSGITRCRTQGES